MESVTTVSAFCIICVTCSSVASHPCFTHFDSNPINSAVKMSTTESPSSAFKSSSGKRHRPRLVACDKIGIAPQAAHHGSIHPEKNAAKKSSSATSIRAKSSRNTPSHSYANNTSGKQTVELIKI